MDNSQQEEAAEAAALAAAAANPQGTGTGGGDDSTDPAVLLRKEQQKNGTLMEEVRHVLVTALKEDSAKGLGMLESIKDTRIIDKVVQDLGFKSKEELIANKGRSTTPPPATRDDIVKIVQEMNQSAQVESTKQSILTEFAKLPDAFQAIVKKEFDELLVGRTLSPDDMRTMAKKALFIAQGTSGNSARYAQMESATISLGGTATPIGEDNDPVEALLAEKAKEDPFWSLGLKKKSK